MSVLSGGDVPVSGAPSPVPQCCLVPLGARGSDGPHGASGQRVASSRRARATRAAWVSVNRPRGLPQASVSDTHEGALRRPLAAPHPRPRKEGRHLRPRPRPGRRREHGLGAALVPAGGPSGPAGSAKGPSRTVLLGGARCHRRQLLPPTALGPMPGAPAHGAGPQREARSMGMIEAPRRICRRWSQPPSPVPPT